MQPITRDQLQKLKDKVDLVEVLAPENFQEYHLPEAKNVPLDERFDERIQEEIPDKSRPVVVYCQDKNCDASPKAAQRMDELGYETVFDYEGGKTDWKSAGLPVEA